MASKNVLVRDAIASSMVAAGVLFCAPLLMPGAGIAQAASEAATTSLERGSEAAKKAAMKEPSYETREERLKAKPLDWKTTIGKPAKPRAPTAAEKQALRQAKPGSEAGGAPQPNAKEEARKLHPEDWR